MAALLTPLARRYAKALFAHSAKASNVAQTQARVAEELAIIAEALAQNAALFAALTAPLISRTQAKAAMRTWAAKANFCQETADGLSLLAANRRLPALPEVSEQFTELCRKSRNEILVKIKTASPLAAQQTEALASKLSAAVGKTVILDVAHQPQLLGGLVLHMESQQIDASVAGKLARARKANNTATA